MTWIYFSGKYEYFVINSTINLALLLTVMNWSNHSTRSIVAALMRFSNKSWLRYRKTWSCIHKKLRKVPLKHAINGVCMVISRKETVITITLSLTWSVITFIIIIVIIAMHLIFMHATEHDGTGTTSLQTWEEQKKKTKSVSLCFH